VPETNRHLNSATAAAEPLDEPPGVIGRVARMNRFVARIAVGECRWFTVLPRITPLRRRGSSATQAASGRGPVAAVVVDPCWGWHVDRFDDVLDPDRDGREGPGRPPPGL